MVSKAIRLNYHLELAAFVMNCAFMYPMNY